MKDWKMTYGVAMIVLGSSVPGAPVAPDARPDLRAFLEQAAASGQTRIVIPPGKYRVRPQDRQHLLLENLNGVEIIADDVELVCTETTRAMTIRNCRNLTLRGLIIDYDPLPFSQGRIVAMSPDKRRHTIELEPGYPAADTVVNRKYEIFAPDTRELRTHTYTRFEVKALAPRRILVTKPQNNRPEHAIERVGDLIVVASEHAPGGWLPHAVVMETSDRVTLDHITLYTSNTFGFYESDCSASRYRHCVIDRRGDRLRSLNADGFHSKFADVGPSYRNCIARYNGDDGIAINGDYHLVTASDGPRLRVIGKRGRSTNMKAGDPVELVSYSGVRLPDAKVLAIESGEPPTENEKAFIRKQRFFPPTRDRMLAAKQTVTIVLDRAVDLPLGSVIASANRLGNGFEVVDCTMGPNRSRGILAKASHGRIENNRLVGNWGQAIKLAPEYFWLEAGSSSDITIANNTVTGCHDTAIAVYAHGGSSDVAPVGAHHGIRITGNRVSSSVNPAIAVTSTSGLVLKDNQIGATADFFIPPWRARDFERNKAPERRVYLKNVEERAAGSANERPNILVIMVDDMRFDLMSHEGHPYVQTPNLDRLAREGMRFTRAFVPTPLCGPVRMSILTGRYASMHGRVDNYCYPDNPGPYLPQSFREQGYRSAMIGKYYEGKALEEQIRAQAYDRWFMNVGPDWSRFTGDRKDAKACRAYREAQLYYDQVYKVDGKPRVVPGHQTDVLFAEAARFAGEETAAEKPFLIFMSPFAPHGPFNPSRRRLGKYTGKGLPPVASHVLDRAFFANPKRREQFAGFHERVAEMVEDIDEGVGTLMASLERSGQLDNTLIIFTSDNGVMQGEHGFGWKRHPWQESIRVPLLIRYPRLIQPGQTCDALVSLQDIFPTCAEIAGVRLPPDAHRRGVSLTPLFRDPTASVRSDFLCMQYEMGRQSDPTYAPEQLLWASLVTADGYKLIRYREAPEQHPELGKTFLFDLNRDPLEMTNLAADPEQTQRLDRMATALHKQLADNQAPTDWLQDRE